MKHTLYPPHLPEFLAQWKEVPLEHRIIFIHVPKTAGSFVRHHLTVNGIDDGGWPQHYGVSSTYDNFIRSARMRFDQIPPACILSDMPLAHTKGLPPPQRLGTYDAALKISVVRNPFDWLVSYYFHEGKIGKEHGWSNINYIHKIESFKEFIIKYCDMSFPWYHKLLHTFQYHQIFDITFPQARDAYGIIAPHGACGVHLLLRFEFLTEGLQTVLRHTGVLGSDCILDSQSIMNSPKRKKRNYKDFYTPELIELVTYKCRDELKMFGYDYEGPIDDNIIIDPSHMSYRMVGE